MQNKKNLFISMNLVEDNKIDSGIANMCIIVEDETYYFESNDVDLTKSSVKLLNNLLFLNNNEETILYKSGEKEITYMKDNRENIRATISNILKQRYNDYEVVLVGDITPFEFVGFMGLIEDDINVNINYISLGNLETTLKMLNLYQKDLFEVILKTEDNNPITNVYMMKKIYNMIKR